MADAADRTALARDIASHGFFAGISDAHADVLAGIARRTHHVAGAALCHEGAPAHELLLLTKGSVRLALHVPSRGEVTLETVGAGDVVGWSWAIPPHRWAFSALATDAVDAIAIDGAALRAACDHDTALGYRVHARLVAVLADRLRHTRVRLLDVYGQR